jgi:hypothetical protein
LIPKLALQMTDFVLIYVLVVNAGLMTLKQGVAGLGTLDSPKPFFHSLALGD